MQPLDLPATHAAAIVLVEDVLEMQMIFFQLLHDITTVHEIVIVTTGTQALRQVALRTVPLLITKDLMLDASGIELAKVVKQISPHTRVALITRQTQPDLERQALLAGVDYFLPKPFRLQHFEEIVHTTIEVHRTP